jgi:WD40 repeat protein
MAFAPDGKALAIPASSAVAVLYDLSTGKRLRSFGATPNDLPEPIDDGGTTTLAFSPDGKALASFDLRVQRLRIWDVASGDIRAGVMIDPSNSSYLVFSADGTRLFALEPGRVAELDAATGKRLRTFSGPPNQGTLALSPDGKVLAVAGNAVRLWDLTTGKELLTQDRHGDFINMRFAPDGKTLMTNHLGPAKGEGGKGPRYFRFDFWDATTGKRTAQIEDKDQGGKISNVSPDGRVALLRRGNGTFEIREIASGKTLLRADHPGETIAQLELTADGKRVRANLLPTEAEGAIERFEVWDVDAARKVMEVAPTKPVYWGQMRDGGRGLVIVSFPGPGERALTIYGPAGRARPHSTIRLRDDDGLTHPTGNGLLVSEAAREGDATVVTEVATGQVVADLEAEGWRLIRQNGSANGRILAQGTEEGAILLWDLARGELLTVLKGHRQHAGTLVFSPDGKRLASRSQDQTILVWDIEPWQKKAQRADLKLGGAELQKLWQSLASDDARAAWSALAQLVRAPADAVPFLRDQIKPAEAAELQQIKDWIRELSNDKYAVRQAAFTELEKAGEHAAVALERTLETKPSLETRRRIEDLLGKLASSPPRPEFLRLMRALCALEWIGTEESLAHLRTLATGDPDAWLTQEAATTALRRATP